MNSETVIHRIRIPTPFVVGPVNAWLVSGGGDHTLVDAGPDTPDAREGIEAALREHGVALKDLSKVICTHGHADHCGQAHRVLAEAGIPLWGHAEERPMIEGGEHLDIVLRQREYGLARGFPAELFDRSIAYYSAFLHVVSPAEISRAIGDGDRIMMGGAEFEVIHTPGHTPGSICLFDRAGGRFLTGDMVLGKITTNAFFRGTDPSEGVGLRAFAASLRKIIDLPVREVFPGHGAAFSNYRETLDKLQAHHCDRSTRILAALDGDPRTPFEVVRAIFPDLPLSEVWLAFADVLGHVEVLEGEGRVSQERRGEHVVVCPTPK